MLNLSSAVSFSNEACKGESLHMFRYRRQAAPSALVDLFEA
jgi:hypothetical protein